MADRKQRRKRWLVVAAVWTVLVFIAGSLPTSGLALPSGSVDKLEHFLAFGLLALLWFEERLAALGSATSAALSAVAMSSLAGGALEIWQAFLPFRSAEIWDLIADVAGAIVFACVAAVAVTWRGKKTAPEQG